MRIGTIYRPPDGKTQMAVDILDKSLHEIECRSANCEIIMIGDYNVDYKKTTSPDYKILKDLERKYQLIQHIKSPTRITNSVRSTIDLIFSNIKFVASCGVLDNEISDHLPIYLVKKKERETKSYMHSMGRCMKDYDKNLFQAHIVAHNDWRLFWRNSVDVNALWDIMINIIYEAADLLCPYKRIRVRDNTPAWFTKEIIEMINTKRDLTRTFVRYNRDEDHSLLKSQKKLV